MVARADTVASEGRSLDLGFIARKLIRSGEMRIQVRDVARAALRADSIARAHAGFLAESHVSQGDRASKDATFVVRVPADSLDGALSGLRQLGTVRNENLGTGDVSHEYSDLETRILVKEETAGRIRDLLRNRTGTLTDVLQVERELSRVVTELEQMKAQRRDYDRQIAMSNVAISVFEPSAEGLGVLRASAAESMQHLTDVLASSIGMVVSLITYLVPWVVLGALGWWCVRTMRRAY